MKIKEVKGLEVLDSRGNPTVQVFVKAGSYVAKALVPSGVSTGRLEAVELRDGSKRYNGLGVRRAVKNVSLIGKHLKGLDVLDLGALDFSMCELDNTINKSKLGANAILGVSMACARLGAKIKGKPLYRYLGSQKVLPVPYFNVIEGGVHAFSGLSFQEYHIVPQSKLFSECLRIGAEVYHALGKKLKCGIGDEGGYSCKFKDSVEPLDVLCKVIDNLGYNVKLSLDVAASEFYHKGKYKVDGKLLSGDKLLDLYSSLISKYPITSVEDPFDQEDWMNFYLLSKKFPRLQVVGDDLLVTSIPRIVKAVKAKACNCLLLKLNQVGTVTEGLNAGKFALKNGFRVMVSHRGGDVCDDFVSDLAVGLGCGQVKFGAPCRGERVMKYNRLLEIENR